MLRVRTSKYTFDEHVRDDDEKIGNALGGNGAARPSRRGKLGATRKSFADPACRRRWDHAAAEFVTQALADGRLTITDLRNGVPATRALVWRGAVAEGAVQIELLPGEAG